MSAECSKVLIDAAGSCSATNQKFAVALADCATGELITVSGAIQFYNSAAPGWTTGNVFDLFTTDADAYAKQTAMGHYANGCDKIARFRGLSLTSGVSSGVTVRLQGKKGSIYYDIDISGLAPNPDLVLPIQQPSGPDANVTATRLAAYDYYRLIVTPIASMSYNRTITVKRTNDGFGTVINTYVGTLNQPVTTPDIPAPSSNVNFLIEVQYDPIL